MLKIKGKVIKCIMTRKRRMKAGFLMDKTIYYVLLIIPKKTDSLKEEKIYKRVGVGYVARKYIYLGATGSAELVSIQ